MIKNYIIGKRSNLSSRLKKILPNSVLISLKDMNEIEELFREKKKFNIIYNNFYPVSLLNEIDTNNLDKLITETVTLSAFLLKNLNYKLVNKILYTSSSSVYESMKNIKTPQDKFNRKLYASLKLSNENLFLNTADSKKIKCYVVRLFNLYGGRDNFSIVQKIVNCQINNKKLFLFNNGDGIRDFIHINDVSKIYKIILETKKKVTEYFRFRDWFWCINKINFRLHKISKT